MEEASGPMRLHFTSSTIISYGQHSTHGGLLELDLGCQGSPEPRVVHGIARLRQVTSTAVAPASKEPISSSCKED